MDTDSFIEQVRSLAQLPDSDEDFTDERILNFAYLGLLERFTHPIIMTRSGSWLHSYTFTTTAGVSRYRLPPRSVVQGLEKIECACAQGLDNADASGWYLLAVQTSIQATDYEGRQAQYRPVAFTYVGDNVEIFPTPTSNWVLRVWYYLRPVSLLTSTEAALTTSTLSAITNLGAAGFRLLFTNSVLGTPALNAGKFDLQFADGNCEYVLVDAPVLGGSAGNTIFTNLTANEADIITRGLATSSLVGLVAAASTPLICLPQELCNALVSYVGAVILAEKGDSEKAQVFSQKAELAIKNIIDIAIPRSKGQPSVFKTRNSYLRRRVSRFGMRGGFGF